jgi:hypothetical protein
MMKVRSAVVGGLLLVLCACEHIPPVTVPALPPPPASGSATLSPAARASLGETIDTGALDRLLNTLSPEHRARFLQTFEDVELAASGRTDMETRDVTMTVWFSDPERQMLLEHVWAPFWAQLPWALLSDTSHPLPGRTLAAARQADSASAAGKERKP